MIQIPELKRTPIDFCRELYSNELKKTIQEEEICGNSGFLCICGLSKAGSTRTITAIYHNIFSKRKNFQKEGKKHDNDKLNRLRGGWYQ